MYYAASMFHYDDKVHKTVLSREQEIDTLFCM